jgi:hypothetical protein
MREKRNVREKADALHADMKKLCNSPSPVGACISRRPYSLRLPWCGYLFDLS